MKNLKIIMAGGTGFIGQSLVKYFGKENDLVILGRLNKKGPNNAYNQQHLTRKDGYRVDYKTWDGKTPDHTWCSIIDGANMVINLAGRSVNCRYLTKQKQEILDSRILATLLIGDAIRQAKKPPELWINASSATIYRNETESPNDEYNGIISEWRKDNMPANFINTLRSWKNKWLAGSDMEVINNPDLDFSVHVCKTWEKEFFDQSTPGTRKVALRSAVTLGTGGVLTPFLNLCKFGLGGKHGNGCQMFSWVHEEDLAGMIEWLWENKKTEGVYNCSAPYAVTNKEFMRILRKKTGHFFGLPAPAWLLELGAFMIRTETELMLKSRWVYPRRAMQEGFRFKYEKIEDAFSEIISHLDRKQYHFF